MTPEHIQSVLIRHATSARLDPHSVLLLKLDKRNKNYAVSRCRGAIGRELLNAGMNITKISRIFRQGWPTTYEQIHQKQQQKRRTHAQAAADYSVNSQADTPQGRV